MTKRQEGRRLVAIFRKRHYDELLDLQGGHCALCPSTGGKVSLNVDHDHKELTVRGLLCAGCNRKLPEYVTPEWLEAAAEYLRNPPARQLTDADEFIS